MSKKILSILMSVVLLISILPQVSITAFAATTSWVGSSSYGWSANHTAALNEVKALMKDQTSQYKMDRFELILSEFPLSGYFNKSKTTGCDWHCGECGKKDSDSCISSFYDSETNQTIQLNATQCAGYGNYCEYRFFGKIIKNGITVSSSSMSSASNFKNYIAGLGDLTGAHFRVNNYHSLVYLARDDKNMYFIDANSGYGSSTGASSGKCSNNTSHYSTCCKINLRRFTYSELINKYSNIKIYYSETTDGGGSTNNGSSTSSVSIVSDADKNEITDTNAILYAMVYKPSSAAVNKIGIKVRRDGSTYDKGWSVYQDPSKNYVGHTSMQPYFNMNTELNATLTPGIKYWLQFYVKVDGTEYWSDEYYFSTTGTAPKLTIKYNANGATISSDTYGLTSDGLVKLLSSGSTNIQVNKYGEYQKWGLYDYDTFGLTKEGHKFVGWKLGKDSNTVYDMTTDWKPEEIYPDLVKGDATITAYAVWEPYSLKIHYNANGGTISSQKSDTYYLDDDGIVTKLSNDKPYEQDADYGIAEEWGFVDDSTLGITKKCAKFAGWTLSGNGETVYDMLTSWKPEQLKPELKNGDITATAYAVWQDLEHTYDDAFDTSCNECGDVRTVKGWIKNDDSWYYVNDRGAKATGWGKIDGEYYYFNQNGIMQTGWLKEGNTWYYLKNNGAMATSWLNLNGTYYYFNQSGAMQTGWKQIGGVWYYLKSNGEMYTGWLKSGGTYYYLNQNGAMQTGWKQIDGIWYYFKSSGARHAGWLNLNGTYYYFNQSGAMQTGWKQIGGVWYYLKSNGEMYTGWLKSGGTYYYLNQNGAMQTGWKQIDGIWYYFKSSGARHAGWLNLNGTYYYFNQSGAMQTGWLNLGGTWYYLYSSGAMATNTYMSGGYINSNGVWKAQ